MASDMSRMAIIAASTREPTWLMPADIISVLAPTLRLAVQCQQAISTLSYVAVVSAAYVIKHAMWIAQLLTIQSLLVSKFALINTTTLAAKGSWFIWDCKPMRRLKKKLEFEFFTVMLCVGNHVCVMVFWPGWWLLGVVSFMLWSCLG